MIELQTAIYQKLSLALAVPVYDHVPQVDDAGDNGDYPYVRIESPRDNENDTDNDTGFDTTIQLHVWSRYRGNKEAAELQAQIYNALHRQDLTVTGYGVSDVHQEFSEIMLDPDGITRHGVQRFRIFYEPTS